MKMFLGTVFFIGLLGATSSVYATFIDFGYTGAQQTWVVPVGVGGVQIETWGAQGYTSGDNSGGLGGYTSGDLAVVPGETLYLYVGGVGTVANVTDTLMGGGFNGGGDGVVWANGNGQTFAGGGGGATDLRQGGNTLVDRVIVAGGGGGATTNSSSVGGDGGGLVGGTGGGSNPGTGGSQVAGGSINGAFGQGGDAINDGTTGWVGGGGGGWYGGGASPAHYAGGGGSSYVGGVSSSSMLQGAWSGHGLLRLTIIPEPTTLTLAAFGLLGMGFRRRKRT